MAERARFMSRRALSRSACTEASTAGASSITSNGNPADCCNRPTNRRIFARPGASRAEDMPRRTPIVM